MGSSQFQANKGQYLMTPCWGLLKYTSNSGVFQCSNFMFLNISYILTTLQQGVFEIKLGLGYISKILLVTSFYPQNWLDPNFLLYINVYIPLNRLHSLIETWSVWNRYPSLLIQQCNYTLGVTFSVCSGHSQGIFSFKIGDQ